MATNEKAVHQLLNSARPALLPGWEDRDTGCGELSVRNLSVGSWVVLPLEVQALLPLLDGTRTLNQIAAEILRQTGRVRHQLILDALVRLHAARLLAPLDLELQAFLKAQATQARPSRLAGLLGRLANLTLHLRLPHAPSPARPPKSARAVTPLVVAFLALSALALLPFVAWALDPATSKAALGERPGQALLAILAGVVFAVSYLNLSKAALLRYLGRSVPGLGLGLTVLIPHLSADLRDQQSLNAPERKLYRAAALALLALLAAAFSLACLWHPSPRLFFGTLGCTLVLLANLSPLWPSDLAALLEEAVGSRRLKQLSSQYLMKKLWRNLARKNLGRDELVLMVLGSYRLAYLFLAVGALIFLIPGALDAVTVALLSPRSTAGEAVVAVLVTAFLWTALLFFALSILAALWNGAAQLAAARRGQRPLEVKQVSSLSLDALAQELLAIPPFASLPPDLVRQTLAAGHLQRHRAGAILIAQGDAGNCCFVLRAGRCKVEVEDFAGTVARVATLGPGSLFGEVALLADSPRTSTVTALDEVEVVALDGATFLKLVASGGYEADEVLQKVRIHVFLRETDLLRGLSPDGMGRLVNNVKLLRLAPGEKVVRCGDCGDSMYVIYQGRCEVLDAADRPMATLGEGQYFGEIALATGATRTATVRCAEPSVLVQLDSALYQEVLVQEFSTGLLLDREVTQRLEKLSLN